MRKNIWPLQAPVNSSTYVGKALCAVDMLELVSIAKAFVSKQDLNRFCQENNGNIVTVVMKLLTGRWELVTILLVLGLKKSCWISHFFFFFFLDSTRV
jgi:hypothetical protein